MPRLRIDNHTVEVEPGSTILEAARSVAVEIPTMCHLEDQLPRGSCMICAVKVRGASALLPACAARAEDGMIVETDTEEVRVHRRAALELLLGDHLGDCVGPCQSTCPAHMDIPAMIRQIDEGRFRSAIATVKRHIALPAVLGRICPEICERACRRAVKDAPVSICKLKQFAADVDLESGDPYMPQCKPPTGKQVAIVGAGPAGLAAAYYLLQEGHACVIFDDHELPGGMLRYGVPAERLPREVLDAEIELILTLGAEFRPRTRVSVEPSIAALSEDFDAVLAAVGKLDEQDPVRAGLKTSERGIRVDKAATTSAEGVFAAGSAVTPSRHAVRAVGAGRAAARAIDSYLQDTASPGADRPFSVHIGRLTPAELGPFGTDASESGRVTPARAGFTEDEARREAARCLHCECAGLRGCKLRRYAIEYGASPTHYRGERRLPARERSHPGVVYEPGKCIVCGLCVQIAARAKEPLGLAFVGRGFDVRTCVPFNQPLSKGLVKVAVECVEACPTGALVAKHTADREEEI